MDYDNYKNIYKPSPTNLNNADISTPNLLNQTNDSNLESTERNKKSPYPQPQHQISVLKKKYRKINLLNKERKRKDVIKSPKEDKIYKTSLKQKKK